MIISVLVEKTVAELEWILPVCYEIKKREKGAKIYLFFNEFDKDAIVKKNQFIMSLANEIFDDCYDFRDCMGFTLSYLHKNIHKLKQVFHNKKNSHNKYYTGQMIENRDSVDKQKTTTANLSILKKIASSLKLYVAEILWPMKSKMLSFFLYRSIHKNGSVLLLKQAHGYRIEVVYRAVCMLRAKGIRTIAYPQNPGVQISLDPPKNEDLILFNTDQDRLKVSGCKDIQGDLVTVGVPRYDDRWISYLNLKFDHERKHLKTNQKGKLFLVNLNKEYSWIFSWKRFETYLDEILDVLFSYEGASIIFKPHPSQDLNYLEHRIALRNMNERVRISKFSSIALAAMSDLIITMPSTSIFDLIPSGKPVIEYYNYGLYKEFHDRCAEKNELSYFEKSASAWSTYSEKSGIPTSIYQDMGFVKGASDLKSLKTAVKDLVNVNKSDGFRHFRKFFPPDAASRAAKEVLGLVTSTEERESVIPACEDSVIGGLV